MTIGSRPLRIPHKVLRESADPMYRIDMETIERYINGLSAPASGKVFPPYDGVVDYDLTPDHANGIYETPFTAIDDLCNNKKVRSPVILVMGRQGVSPGQYVETADVVRGTGSTTSTHITIIWGTGLDDMNTGYDPPWQPNGHTCDLGGGAVSIIGGFIAGGSDAFNTRSGSPIAPFINCGLLVCVRTFADDFCWRIGIGSNFSPMNQIYYDCNLALTWNSGLDGRILWYGGRWHIGNIIRLGQTTAMQGEFFMDGCRLVSANPGTANISFSGTPQRLRIHGNYTSPSEISSGAEAITIHIQNVLTVDIDIEGGTPNAGGSLSLNMADNNHPWEVRIRGDYFLLTVTGSTGPAAGGTVVDIDAFVYGAPTVSAIAGKVKITSTRAGHLYQNFLAADIEVSIRDSVGVQNVTVVGFTTCVQCIARVSYWANNTPVLGNTPYSFDATCSKNILDMAGASMCPNPGVDLGAGDLIRTT